MISTKYAPFDRDVLFDLGGLSPEEQSKAFAAFARQEIAIADAQNERALGRAVSYETIVDGRRGAALESVSPNGVIVTNFDLGSDVVQWIWDAVQKHAPVKSGAFRASQRIYADGVEVDGPANVSSDADEIVIASVALYARKIERGLSKQAPDGVYEAIAAMAAQRYGNQAHIRFTYVSPIGGATELERWAEKKVSAMTWVAGRKFKTRRQYTAAERRANEKARLQRQPAIIVRFK